MALPAKRGKAAPRAVRGLRINISWNMVFNLSERTLKPTMSTSSPADSASRTGSRKNQGEKTENRLQEEVCPAIPFEDLQVAPHSAASGQVNRIST